MRLWSNKPDAASPAIIAPVQVGGQWRGVTDPDRWVRMKRLSIICGCAIIGVALLTPRTVTQELPPAPLYRERVPWIPEWPSFPSVPLFGTATTNTILVFVVGEIKQPGGYYLPRGAVVRHAIEAALGLDRLAAWSCSGLLRPRAGRLPRVIEFTKLPQETYDSLALEAGDQVFIGTIYD